MLEWFASLPVRKRVGILAVVLGVIAIFLGDPYNKAVTKVNLKNIASASLESSAVISPEELADWIIKGKVDYRLIDLRPEDEYNEYNIPSSENISPIKILESDLMRNEKIILYSNDNIAAAKVWFILKAKDYKSVYILKGGMNAWKNEILFPGLPADATPEQKAEFDKIAAVSKFFGGQPRSSTSINVTKVSLPKIKAPKKVTVKRAKRKKKREGC